MQFQQQHYGSGSHGGLSREVNTAYCVTDFIYPSIDCIHAEGKKQLFDLSDAP